MGLFIINNVAVLSAVLVALQTNTVAGGCGRRRRGLRLIRGIPIKTVHGDCRRRGLELVSEDEGASSSPTSAKMKQCAYVQYNLFMHTDDHIGLVAVPQDNEEGECPSLYFHDDYGKVMEEVENTEEGSESLMFLSTFTLEHILEAFEVATSHEHGDGGYDIISNNCGSFFLEMTVGLGMEITHEMVNHAVKNLGKSGDTLMALVEHPNFEKVFPEGSAMVEENPEVLMQIFVEQYIKTHVDAKSIAV